MSKITYAKAARLTKDIDADTVTEIFKHLSQCFQRIEKEGKLSEWSMKTSDDGMILTVFARREEDMTSIEGQG